MRRIFMVVALVSVLGLSLKVLGAQDSFCIWVDPEASIQAQIDAAPPWSTLCLPEGTWSENIVINKPLRLRGQGPERTVIQAQETMTLPPVLWVRGCRVGQPFSVVIEGLTLLGRTATTWNGRGVGDTANAGLLVDGFAQVVLHNCHILEALNGILLLDSAQALVSNTKILGQKVRRFQGSGIFLLGRTQAMVVQSTIAQVADGVIVQRDAQVTVRGSTIEDTTFGVHIADDAQAIIAHTRIAESEDGVVLSQRAQAHLANCAIVRNKIGVAVMHHASAVLTNNLIAESSIYGVLLALHDPRVWFAGSISGANNVIPGPNEPGGNLYGAVYPDAISFLTTKEGGVYPQR